MVSGFLVLSSSSPDSRRWSNIFLDLPSIRYSLKFLLLRFQILLAKLNFDNFGLNFEKKSRFFYLRRNLTQNYFQSYRVKQIFRPWPKPSFCSDSRTKSPVKDWQSQWKSKYQ